MFETWNGIDDNVKIIQPNDLKVTHEPLTQKLSTGKYNDFMIYKAHRITSDIVELIPKSEMIIELPQDIFGIYINTKNNVNNELDMKIRLDKYGLKQFPVSNGVKVTDCFITRLYITVSKSTIITGFHLLGFKEREPIIEYGQVDLKDKKIDKENVIDKKDIYIYNNLADIRTMISKEGCITKEVNLKKDLFGCDRNITNEIFKEFKTVSNVSILNCAFTGSHVTGNHVTINIPKSTYGIYMTISDELNQYCKEYLIIDIYCTDNSHTVQILKENSYLEIYNDKCPLKQIVIKCEQTCFIGNIILFQKKVQESIDQKESKINQNTIVIQNKPKDDYIVLTSPPGGPVLSD
jgi:hypothetical protein